MTIHRDVLSRAKVFKLTWLKGSHDTNNHGAAMTQVTMGAAMTVFW